MAGPKTKTTTEEELRAYSAHPEERELYAARKRALAKQEWKFVQHYADAKTGVVHEILARARGASDG